MNIRQRAAVLLLALLTLSGCGAKGQSPANSPEAARPYAVGDALTLVEAGTFDGQMAEADQWVLAPQYGVDPATVVESAWYTAQDTSVSADEVAVFILADNAAAQAAEEACHQRVADQIKVCQTYAPTAIPNLEHAVIDRVDNTVLLAVGNPDRLPKALEELGK